MPLCACVFYRNHKSPFLFFLNLGSSDRDHACIVQQIFAMTAISYKLGDISGGNYSHRWLFLCRLIVNVLQRYLHYYCDDGLAESDSNAAELALRAICLGKKNYIFFGSNHKGWRRVLLYDPIGKYRPNDIGPQAYLRHILSVLTEWSSNKVTELLAIERRSRRQITLNTALT